MTLNRFWNILENTYLIANNNKSLFTFFKVNVKHILNYNYVLRNIVKEAYLGYTLHKKIEPIPKR